MQVHGLHSGRKLEHVLVLSERMRFTYAEAMTNAHFYAPLAQAAEAAGLHLDDGGGLPDLPRGVGLDVPLHRHRRPGVPRGQGVHRDDDPVHPPRGGDDHAAVHAVRAQAAGAAAGAGGQAGQLGGVAERQPARARASGSRRGRRTSRSLGRAVGEARQADGRVHGHPARADVGRVLRLRRRVLLVPAAEADAGADREGAAARRWPRGRGPAARRTQGRRVDARRR